MRQVCMIQTWRETWRCESALCVRFKEVVDFSEFALVEAELGSSNNGVNLVRMACADDCARDGGILQCPGNGSFGGRALIEHGNFAQFVGQRQIPREARFLEFF